MPVTMGSDETITPDIHVGDTGTAFISTIKDQDEEVVNISGATSLKFRFESPANIVVEKTGILNGDGTDGKMKYIVESGLFDSAGKWKYQAIVTMSGGSEVWHSTIIEFDVKPRLVVT